MISEAQIETEAVELSEHVSGLWRRTIPERRAILIRRRLRNHPLDKVCIELDRQAENNPDSAKPNWRQVEERLDRQVAGEDNPWAEFVQWIGYWRRRKSIQCPRWADDLGDALAGDGMAKPLSVRQCRDWFECETYRMPHVANSERVGAAMPPVVYRTTYWLVEGLHAISDAMEAQRRDWLQLLDAHGARFGLDKPTESHEEAPF